MSVAIRYSIVMWFALFLLCFFCFVFFFKQKTAYEMRISDWSSDVCSSDLVVNLTITLPRHRGFLQWSVGGRVNGVQSKLLRAQSRLGSQGGSARDDAHRPGVAPAARRGVQQESVRIGTDDRNRLTATRYHHTAARDAPAKALSPKHEEA